MKLKNRSEMKKAEMKWLKRLRVFHGFENLPEIKNKRKRPR